MADPNPNAAAGAVVAPEGAPVEPVPEGAPVEPAPEGASAGPAGRREPRGMEGERAEAAAWFRALRGEIVAAFEALEDGAEGMPGTQGIAAGRFEVTPTRRASEDGSDAGGGIMSVMRGGRLFEKVGVNWSEVHGALAPRAQAAMAARGVPGMAEDPRFWASGISLVAHMRNPHVPSVHMNTRMFWTPGAWWFGGGTDLNPALEYEEDTAHFHGVLREALAPYGDLRPLQGLGGRVLLRAPPGPGAGRGGRVLRRPEHRRLGDGLRAHAGRGPRLPAGLRCRWWCAAAGRAGTRRRRMRSSSTGGSTRSTTSSTIAARGSGSRPGTTRTRC